MQYSVFTGWHIPARGIKQVQWSWWPYLTGASSGGTSTLNKFHSRIRTQDPPDREAAGALNYLVLSAHGEEEEGISPNASQREESLASYWTHCHILMGSIIYFTQWLARGRRTGGSKFGRRAAVRDSQNSLGVFPIGFRWGQVAQNSFSSTRESRKPWRHILVCMDSLPALWACPQVPRPFQPPRRRVPHCSSPQFSHLIIAPS